MARPERRSARSTRRSLYGRHDDHWLRRDRARKLSDFVRRIDRLDWNLTLLQTLLEELYCDDADDGVAAYLGNLSALPANRYPQAIAMALALRHSWQAADFDRLLSRLGAIAKKRELTGQFQRTVKSAMHR